VGDDGLTGARDEDILRLSMLGERAWTGGGISGGGGGGGGGDSRSLGRDGGG